MRVLITGHGGFVGHHCLQYFLENTDWDLVCIDSFRHKGTICRVVEVGGENPRVKTFIHDLTVPIDPQLSNLLTESWIDPMCGFMHYKSVDVIVNVASHSAVERSTEDPVSCVRNNYNLMLNMLEYARTIKNLKLFLHVSTDEVYGDATICGSHREWAPILPSNPYAASKAAQEALAISYWRTYNLPVVIVNIMNIIGERQDAEKFLPKIIQKIAKGEEVPIYVDENNSIGSRSYLHAKNVADALKFIISIKPTRYDEVVKEYDCKEGWGLSEDPVRPDRYNIPGDTELNNLEMAELIASIMKKPLKYTLVKGEKVRPGYDRRYMLDGSKIASLGWKPPLEFKKSLEETVQWTLNNPHWII